MSFRYLASPYMHPDADVRLNRFNEAVRCMHWLLYQRIWTFSPIVHGHSIAVQFGMPKDAQFWTKFNEAILEKADEMLILTLDGWEDSKGIRDEVAFCCRPERQYYIPIRYISPQAYTISLPDLPQP